MVNLSEKISLVVLNVRGIEIDRSAFTARELARISLTDYLCDYQDLHPGAALRVEKKDADDFDIFDLFRKH